MPSGKQILLRVLSELSQGSRQPCKRTNAADKVRAAFLLHGSTAAEAWSAIEGLDWTAEVDSRGRSVREGVTFDGVFLSDLLEELISPSEMPPHIAAKFPELSAQRYHEATYFLWLILSSVQWFDELQAVETEPAKDGPGEEMLANMMGKLRHFRSHPEDFT